MKQPTVVAYTIGQSPRPDLTEDLARRFPAVQFEIVGALDALAGTDIPTRLHWGYPLETRLRDGSRVVVGAAFVAPLLQRAVADMDPRASAHLILCAGPFPNLVATAPLIVPFDCAVAELTSRRLRRLDVVVPFSDQATPAVNKWGAAGFSCRAHVFAERPRHRSATEWVSGLLRHTRAQALVFDYVGFPSQTLDEIVAAVDLPVFDLGRLALDALAGCLGRDAGHVMRHMT